MRWYELQAANGSKIKGDGAVWAPTVADGEQAVVIHPGRGVIERPSPIFPTEHDTVPAVQTSEYARRFGNEPGPEWEVNGRPYAVTWTIVLQRDEAGELIPYVTTSSYDAVTPAARRTIVEWLTSPEVLAEVSDARAHAVARVDSTAGALHYEEKAVADAQARRDTAADAHSEARAALVRLDAEKVDGIYRRWARRNVRDK